MKVIEAVLTSPHNLCFWSNYFLIFAPNIDCGGRVRTASMRRFLHAPHNLCLEQK